MRSVLPGSLRYLHGSRRTWVVDDREISLAVADRTSASSGSASITVTSTGGPAGGGGQRGREQRLPGRWET